MSTLEKIRRYIRNKQKDEMTPEEFLAQLERIARERQGIINRTRPQRDELIEEKQKQFAGA
jgi:hypothetical protein